VTAAAGIAAAARENAAGAKAGADKADKEYTVKNGIRIYKAGKAPKLPIEWPKNFEVISPFGFKIVTLKPKRGKEKQSWAVATEKDYRKVMAKLHGIAPKDVKVKNPDAANRIYTCHNVSPTACQGLCDGGGVCELVYCPVERVYICTCE
jgi:hypothetical protein